MDVVEVVQTVVLFTVVVIVEHEVATADAMFTLTELCRNFGKMSVNQLSLSESALLTPIVKIVLVLVL